MHRQSKAALEESVRVLERVRASFASLEAVFRRNEHLMQTSRESLRTAKAQIVNPEIGRRR
jgi:hypothetical protein